MEPEDLETGQNSAATPNSGPAMAAPTAAVAAAPAPTASAAPTMSADDAVRAERQRIRRISDQAAPFLAAGQIAQDLVQDLIETGATPEAAGARMLQALEPTPSMSGGGSRPARIVRDEVDTRREGLTAALMRDYSGPGAQFRNLRLRSLAMELSAGVGGYSDVDRVRGGLRSTSMMGGAHGVSDFAIITSDAMNRTLQMAYAERAHTWRAVTGEPIRAADFREQHRGKFGGDFELRKVEENGAYERAVLVDEAEGLRVERYGRDIVITFEAVMNDDMGAFDRIPGEFARASRNLESSIVWGLIRSNAALKSGGALFRTADKNLLGSGSVISATSVAAMRKLAAEQKAPGATAGSEILGAQLDLLIVPQALELAALAFTTVTSPSSDGEVNPYKASTVTVVEPLLGSAVSGGSDTAWYMGSRDLPPLTAAYLDGYEAPMIQTAPAMNPYTVTMTAHHMFGAAPTERRGIVKNPGA